MFKAKAHLAIDTSTEICSVALLKNKSAFVLEEKTPQSHGQVILSLVKKAIEEANIQPADIQVIAFGRGPGAFTGLRIGIGVVQGLAYGLNRPVVPVSTLQALAQTAFLKTGENFILVALNAQMREVYYSAFSVTQGIAMPIVNECVLKPEQILVPTTSKEWLAVGSGFDRYKETLKRHSVKIQHVSGIYPSALAVAKLGALAYDRGETVSAEKALPVYLRSYF